MDKKVINSYFDLHIDSEMSEANDAGWHGMSIDHRECPQMGLNRAVHDNKMIWEIRYIQDPEIMTKIANAAAKWLKVSNHNGNKCGKRYYDAIYNKLRYKDSQEIEEGKRITNEIRAHMIGQTVKEYENSLSKAYILLDGILPVLEETFLGKPLQSGAEYDKKYKSRSCA